MYGSVGCLWGLLDVGVVGGMSRRYHGGICRFLLSGISDGFGLLWVLLDSITAAYVGYYSGICRFLLFGISVCCLLVGIRWFGFACPVRPL